MGHKAFNMNMNIHFYIYLGTRLFPIILVFIILIYLNILLYFVPCLHLDMEELQDTDRTAEINSISPEKKIIKLQN